MTLVWGIWYWTKYSPLTEIFFNLITCLLDIATDIVQILYGEILSWSPMGVKWLTFTFHDPYLNSTLKIVYTHCVPACSSPHSLNQVLLGKEILSGVRWTLVPSDAV